MRTLTWIRSAPALLAASLFPTGLVAAQSETSGFWDLFGDESIFDDMWKMRGELRATYSISGWSPASIEGTTIETTGLNIATVELNLSSGIYDRLLLPKLPSVRYDWTPGGDNELQRGLQDALVTAREEDSFTRFLGNTSVLGGFLGEEAFGTLDLDYEVFAFSSTIELEDSKEYIPFEGEPMQLSAGSKISTMTLFEKWRVAGSVLFDIEKERTQHTGDFGPFFLTYQKPYAFTLEGQQDASAILDSRFEAWGLGVNYKMLHQLAGQSDEKYGLFAKTMLGIDFGPAEVEFANDTTLQQSLPPNENVLFIGLNADFTLSWVTRSGFGFELAAGARYFNFQATEGGYTYAQVGEVDVNEDFVWFANAGVSFVF